MNDGASKSKLAAVYSRRTWTEDEHIKSSQPMFVLVLTACVSKRCLLHILEQRTKHGIVKQRFAQEADLLQGVRLSRHSP
eukprot:1990427-Amphidinium_carterae.1